MRPTYTLSTEAITRSLKVGRNETTESRDVNQFIDQVGQVAPLDSGLLPAGLRYYAQAGRHTQMLLELPPGINRIIWGEREGDADAATYLLAQPYRIILADFVGGGFLGARMFYSPIPLNSLDQQLYHQNVPNINCRGYEGNAVGWVCLYHGTDTSKMNLAGKVAYVIERCGGAEAYNNRNMSMTDGTRFYAMHEAPQFLTDPAAWEAKSEAEGWEWTLDADLWLPVLVDDIDNQDHHVADGQPLTVRMAMDGYVPVYYHDDFLPKTAPARRRNEATGLFKGVVDTAFAKSKRIAAAKTAPVTENPAATVPSKPQPKPEPKTSVKLLEFADSLAAQASTSPQPQPEPQPEIIGTCRDCEAQLPVGGAYLVDGKDLVCTNCYAAIYVACNSCGYAAGKDTMVWDEREGYWLCDAHGKSVTCLLCSTDVASVHSVTVISGDAQLTLCAECADTTALCNGCSMLYERNSLFEHGLHVLCENCLTAHKQATADVPASEKKKAPSKQAPIKQAVTADSTS